MQTKHLPLRVSERPIQDQERWNVGGASESLFIRINISDALGVNSKHLHDSLLGAKAFCNSPFTVLWHGNKWPISILNYHELFMDACRALGMDILERHNLV